MSLPRMMGRKLTWMLGCWTVLHVCLLVWLFCWFLFICLGLFVCLGFVCFFMCLWFFCGSLFVLRSFFGEYKSIMKLLKQKNEVITLITAEVLIRARVASPVLGYWGLVLEIRSNIVVFSCSSLVTAALPVYCICLQGYIQPHLMSPLLYLIHPVAPSQAHI